MVGRRLGLLGAEPTLPAYLMHFLGRGEKSTPSRGTRKDAEHRWEGHGPNVSIAEGPRFLALVQGSGAGRGHSLSPAPCGPREPMPGEALAVVSQQAPSPAWGFWR